VKQQKMADPSIGPEALILRRVSLDLIPRTVWVEGKNSEGVWVRSRDLRVTEIRDHFVFTETSGPWCLDDGAFCCHIESGTRLTAESLATCTLAVRLDNERRRKTPVQP